MAEAAVEKEILTELRTIQDSITSLKEEFAYIRDYIEDSKLTEEEREQLNESLAKIRAGDTSDFVSWEKAKTELGL